MIERPILLDLPMPVFTPRLRIVPTSIEHAEQFQNAIEESRDSLRPWMIWADNAETLEDRREFMVRKQIQFLLREEMMLLAFTHEGEFVVSTGFHNIDWNIPMCEMGYWCRTSAQGKGYVTEAANALVRYAFETMRMRKITLGMDSENTASENVAKRLNMQLEYAQIGGTRTLHGDGNLRNCLYYSCFDTNALPKLG